MEKDLGPRTKQTQREREIEREREREREKEGIAIMCYFFYSTLHSHTTFSGLVVLAKKYFVAFFRKSLSHSSFVVFSEKKNFAHISALKMSM